MSALNVAIVQAELYWHSPAANLAHFGTAIAALQNTTDIVVLPEMFTSGFTMDAETHAEDMDGRSVNWMRQMAADSGAAVCGSLIIRAHEQFFNRFVFMRPDGNFDLYDKRHLFRLAHEQHHYSPGNELITIEWRGFRIRPMVCYDLRFPVWSRNDDSYDLLIYVANWPNRRHLAWETLLRARAIENLCFVAGVNRTGTDGNDLPYSGGSAIVDYLGQEMASLGDRVGTAAAALSLADLRNFRERFAFHMDADNFSLDDAGTSGAD